MNIKKILTGFSALVLMLGILVSPTFAAKPFTQTLNGGGQIVEGEYNVSFGGNVKNLGNSLKGQFQANFHNVSDEDVSGGRFHSTEITDATWFEGAGNCEAAMNVTMTGRFNGEADYELVVRAGNDEDTLRLTLSDPTNTVVYDTFVSGDFPGESNCVGTARTGVDSGDLKINL